MRTIVLAVFLIGTATAWGQKPKETPAVTDKVDRATAYYHYALARMYAEMAIASRGANPDYVTKAIENYKAALTADPQSAILHRELSQLSTYNPVRVSPPVVRPPATRK